MDRDIVEKLSRGHLTLINWRALRPYLGGWMIDSLKGLPESQRKDGYRPEEWIGSCVRASLGMNEAPNEGLSLIKLPSGITVYLKEIVQFCPVEILGKAVVDRFGCEFPVLTKFLDSAQRLPAQFHPSAEFIRTRGMGTRGKKEAWLILDTRRGSQEEPCIYLCFNRSIDKDKFDSLVNTDGQEKQLQYAHKFSVSPGDVWLVEEGQYHAIGPGVFMVEVQESSDWIVLTENKVGNLVLNEKVCYMNLPREDALQCADFTGYAENEIRDKYKKTPQLLEENDQGQRWQLIRTDCFSAEKWIITRKMQETSDGSYRIGIVIKGNGTLNSLSGQDSLKPGDSFLIPASAQRYSLQRAGKENLEIIFSLPPV